MANEIIPNQHHYERQEVQTAVASLDMTARVLDGLDAMIYVTDPETNEILFINEMMKQHCRTKGEAGDICYRALQQGMNERCPSCPVSQLEKDPGRIIIREARIFIGKRTLDKLDTVTHSVPSAFQF